MLRFLFGAKPAEATKVETQREGFIRLLGELNDLIDGLDPKPAVTKVAPGTPADNAGLRQGDVLREVGGRRIIDYGDAVNAFFLLLPGRTVNVKVEREGNTLSVPVTPAVQ